MLHYVQQRKRIHRLIEILSFELTQFISHHPLHIIITTNQEKRL